jgi:DNA polymerase-3 subunit alpha
MGMPALAMTDHGNVFGAYDFWKKARAAGVKPIIGTEAYLTPGTHRSDKTRVRWADGGEDDVSGGGAYTHMTMWAENTAGMHNLFRLSSLASLEGQYYKPRMDRELLQTYANGLIATTGCPGGEVQTLLRIGRYDDAVRSAAEFRDIFGRENFFVEVMDHGLPVEQRVRLDLLRLAKDLDLPLVATNDLHYTYARDAEAHAVLLCVQSGRTLADPTRFKFEADDFYLKTPAEMRDVWRDLPDACDNTLAIAERVDVKLDKSPKYPNYVPPPGKTQEQYLREITLAGLIKRYGERSESEDVRRRYELEIDLLE